MKSTLWRQGAALALMAVAGYLTLATTCISDETSVVARQVVEFPAGVDRSRLRIRASADGGGQLRISTQPAVSVELPAAIPFSVETLPTSSLPDAAAAVPPVVRVYCDESLACRDLLFEVVRADASQSASVNVEVVLSAAGDCDGTPAAFADVSLEQVEPNAP